jgi:hypothetical protein
MNFCIHYVSKLLTLVYAFYDNPVDDIESHWGQWSVIDE